MCFFYLDLPTTLPPPTTTLSTIITITTNIAEGIVPPPALRVEAERCGCAFPNEGTGGGLCGGEGPQKREEKASFQFRLFLSYSGVVWSFSPSPG